MQVEVGGSCNWLDEICILPPSLSVSYTSEYNAYIKKLN